VITPHLLGGEEVLTYEYSDPRKPLMDWMLQADNPYFARALVNRVWADYLGVGIIDPPDDLNLANPPSNAALLDWLADQFVAHKYDLKWLHRTIVQSRTYQLSWRPNKNNLRDERNYSKALVRRLPAEVAYDALVLAVAGDEARQALTHDPVRVRNRAIGRDQRLCRHKGRKSLRRFPLWQTAAGSQLRLRAIRRADALANGVSPKRRRNRPPTQ
jgi:hypothetical protein